METSGRVRTLALTAGLGLLLPMDVSAEKKLSDYPLRIEILRVGARCLPSPGSQLPCTNGYNGFGVGNMEDEQSVVGFEFEYRCLTALRSSFGASWVGKWKKPQLKLVVVIPRVGQVDKYDECELQTRLSSEPGGYVPSREGPRYLAPDAFKAVRARRMGATPAHAEAGGPKEATASAAPSREPEPDAALTLVVSSNPDGADIEVDGRFMGSTTSSIKLAPGEHVFVVRKPGYRPWERKLQLMGEDVKLNADLEKVETP